jgi:hypothetical protein
MRKAYFKIYRNTLIATQMLAKKISTLIYLTCLLATQLKAQDVKSTVQVNGQRINSVDAKYFQSLQSALAEFVNNRKWTEDNINQQEKFEINIFLSVTKELEPNTFEAQLTIQSSRPVYNSVYNTTLLNYIDKDVVFKFEQFSQLQFSETAISSGDPLNANLTALVSYYVYLALGMDYNSFSTRTGNTYFLKAQNIVNNAPDNKYIKGWRNSDGNKNRYWIIDNIRNSRFSQFHDAVYTYHRQGMDKFYDDANAARTSMLNAINILYNLNLENPNSPLVQLFFLGKSEELYQVFSQANPSDKTRAAQMLSAVDVTNASKYNKLTK